VAAPQSIPQDELWSAYHEHFANNPLARKVWDSNGIVSRHYAVDPRLEPVIEWSTPERMQRYSLEARPLGRQAVRAALESAGLGPGDIGLFAVATCTGHVVPGLDILLSHDLKMAPDMRRVVIGNMGCHAAFPGLGIVSEYVVANDRPALLLCIELTSLHVQPRSATLHGGTPTTEDFEQIVAHSLFADGAAAVVVAPPGDVLQSVGTPNLEIHDIVAVSDHSVREYMTWDITDHGFVMRLSPRVPEVIRRNVGGLVGKLLAKNGLDRADVGGWAVHPGGVRILQHVVNELKITDEEIAPSYEVLREYGNCSSASILIVLWHMLQTRRVPPGKPVVALGFGPGMTLFAALLKA
jgi:predicted naringenin-chalcone synthase